MIIEELYAQRCAADVQHPDIYEHLPTLRRYAEQVMHVTEIGTRTGNSTTALLAGLAQHGGVMHSYDKDEQAFTAPEIAGVTWTFHRCNTHAHEFQPEPTELLLVDGDHSYSGVSLDLRMAPLVWRWIILHDTSEEWIKDGGRGVYDALADFMRFNADDWRVAEVFTNCNGLTVLERKK